MDEKEESALTSNLQRLVKRLDLEDNVLDYLVEKRQISEPEARKFHDWNQGRDERNRAFIECLRCKGKNAYSHFIIALRGAHQEVNKETAAVLVESCAPWQDVPPDERQSNHSQSQLIVSEIGPSTPLRHEYSYSTRSRVGGGNDHVSDEVRDKREAPPDGVPPKSPTDQHNVSSTKVNLCPSKAGRTRTRSKIPIPCRSSGQIPPPKPHQRSSSPIASEKATDGREEDQPAQLSMTKPDIVDRIQSSRGNFHQPEQSQPSQGTTELADLANSPNSSPVSSEEHHGPAARATYVKQRRRLSSSAPTTPCATGVDHLPVLGAKLGDHPTPASSQISQHRPGPDMTAFAADTLTRRETRNAQLSLDGRAPSTRSVHQNGGSGDSSDAATASTSDTVDALASLSVSPRSQGGARHTAPAAPSFCPPPSKPAALWTVSLPVYHRSDYPSHEERAEGCHSEPEQEQAPRRHMFAFKLKQDWPRRTHDRIHYLADLYAYGVEKEMLVTHYVHQFGEVFFSFEVDELSTVQKALSSGVKIRKKHVDILRGVYRVEVQGCPLRMTPEDVRKLLSQYGLVIVVPYRDRIDANAYHGEYYADMLLSQEYAAKSGWAAKTRESWVELKKLPF